MPRRNKRAPLKRRVYKPSSASSAKHKCNWPGCPQLVDARKWGCTPHLKTLPLDIRGKLAKAFGPPKLVYYPKVQEAIVQWIKNQNPGNYPGIPFY